MDPRPTFPLTRGRQTNEHPHMLWTLAQNGECHFVTFYMCEEYWSTIDPLLNGMPPSPRMQYKLLRALNESFNSHHIPFPALPPYRQLPRIAIQRDAPLPLRSCGIFAMSTTLHLLLGGRRPHSPPTNYITRADMMVLNMALLELLVLAPTPRPMDDQLSPRRHPNPTRGLHNHMHVNATLQQTSSQEVRCGSPWAHPPATMTTCGAHTRHSQRNNLNYQSRGV